MIDFYQTIPELGIKGRINTPEEFEKIGLPKDLSEKSVLDIGCNIGAYLIECGKRGATVLTGAEPNLIWRLLAQGIGVELLQDNYNIYNKIEDIYFKYDLVLLLSITHVCEGITGQEILDRAYMHTKTGGLLIIEINDRLQKEKLVLPKEAKLYGHAKDNRSVYHVVKSND